MSIAMPEARWNAFGGARNAFWDTGQYGVRTATRVGQAGGSDPRYMLAPGTDDHVSHVAQLTDGGLSGPADDYSVTGMRLSSSYARGRLSGLPDPLGLGADPVVGIPWWLWGVGAGVAWWLWWR